MQSHVGRRSATMTRSDISALGGQTNDLRRGRGGGLGGKSEAQRETLTRLISSGLWTGRNPPTEAGQQNRFL